MPPPPGFYTFTSVRNHIEQHTKGFFRASSLKKMCARLGIELYPRLPGGKHYRYLSEAEVRSILEDFWANRGPKQS